MSIALNNNTEHNDEHHHHEETYLTKWIFSQDHKMIAKQYFITGVIVMGIIGVLMSLLFRIQLAWPEESFSIFNLFLGDRWAPDGVMDPNIFGTSNNTRNHNGIFCVDCWVEWNF